MSTYKKICVTNRHLVKGDFLARLEDVCRQDVDLIILREKDLEEDAYTALAKDVIDLTNAFGKRCMLHSFPKAALSLGHPDIHLPMPQFLAMEEKELARFRTVGVSVHAVSEARMAQQRGASYLIAGHIFETDCKKGAQPRGLSFLKDVCDAVDLNVYAIGGISEANYESCLLAGAAGICQMSGYMRDHCHERSGT